MSVVNSLSGRILSKHAGLTDRQVIGIATEEIPDRDNEILTVDGADLSEYLKNPIVLFSHDARKPIGRASLRKVAYAIEATITFPPVGLSPTADEVCGLVKSGVLSGLSVGFLPRDWAPAANSGRKFTSWKMLELSIVSIPCNPSAVITQRSSDSVSARAARELEIARLRAERDAIINAPTAAHYCAAMREKMEREAIQRAAAVYARDPEVLRADRMREIARLRSI
ncbi:MAG TPA: HK97 family phage prohead protease [Methylocystis sp.]|jgi:HK97 family phage prohead protease